MIKARVISRINLIFFQKEHRLEINKLKFKKLTLLGVILILNLLTFGQARLKGNVMISAGFSRSDLYTKLFILDLANKNGPIYPNSQIAETFLDFNAVYFFKKNIWKLKPVVGFGYSPQGFIEKGVAYNDSMKLFDYSLPLKLDYISIFGGFSFKILSKNSVNIKFTQTVNPMIDIGKSNNVFRKLAVSVRSNILVDCKFKNGGVACISPFFQTCVTRFNKVQNNPQRPNYYPFSYGITVGTYFKH